MSATQFLLIVALSLIILVLLGVIPLHAVMVAPAMAKFWG